MAWLTLVPAYGRDYKSKAAVLADWEANKDFLAVGIGGQGYVNKADAPAGEHNIRYAKQTKVAVVKK